MARENSPAVIGGDPSRAAGRLSGKRAIVTGAGSGIGRAASRLFAAEGAAVLVVDRVAESVEQTAAMIREAGGRAVAVAADAGSEPDVQAVVARAAAELGGLDVVYANAGVSGGMILSLMGPASLSCSPTCRRTCRSSGRCRCAPA